MYLTFKVLFFWCGLFLVLNNCTRSYKFEKESAIFSKYLQATFNIELKNEHECYLVIPDYSCIGCVKLSTEIISACKNVIVIATPYIVDDNADLLDDATLLVDKTYNINRLDIGQRNSYIIVANDKRIQNIVQITPNNEQVIWSQLSECSCL